MKILIFLLTAMICLGGTVSNFLTNHPWKGAICLGLLWCLGTLVFIKAWHRLISNSHQTWFINQ